MISLKRFLDLETPGLATEEHASDDISAAALACYRSMLLAVAKCAVQIHPNAGADLDKSLRGFEKRIAVGCTAESLAKTEQQVEVHLDEWGTRTHEQFKSQAGEIKELILALANTAKAIGSRDQRCSSQFIELTGRLEGVADLDDLSQVRSTISSSVKELKSSVEQMTRENQEVVAQLRAEISIYETRLKSAEHLALKDDLTGLANRRSVEERMSLNIDKSQEFCILMVDLNRFKYVNDTYGHLAGDDLLKQFATELQLNTRTGDLVGRWGGDEFVVVLACNEEAAKSHMQRMREWVFGKYTVHGAGKGSVVMQVDASVGVAQWLPGKTIDQLIAEADASMYLAKNLSRRSTD